MKRRYIQGVALIDDNPKMANSTGQGLQKVPQPLFQK
jgi:hypothetical protein